MRETGSSQLNLCLDQAKAFGVTAEHKALSGGRRYIVLNIGKYPTEASIFLSEDQADKVARCLSQCLQDSSVSEHEDSFSKSNKAETGGTLDIDWTR